MKRISGEDEKFRAAELNYLGPTARGWRSSANCTFPQEIILQLKVFAVLHQIQILAHQYLIPEKIEICTSSELDSDTLRSNSRDLFEYLGYITFSDNKATGFRSRELKSISIPSKKAKYIKLKIHKNHVNVKNIYNQVSLMAVNVLGNELHGRNEETEMNNNINFHPTASYPSAAAAAAPPVCNSNYLSPYDDLAFQMSVDEETARIIKIVECKMFQAVFGKRLDHAKALKITIENLRAAGEILGIYEQEKRKAIDLEDFDEAKSKKIQIDRFRQKIYATLRIDKFLDDTRCANECDLNSNSTRNEAAPMRNSPRRSQNDNVRNLDCESPSRMRRPQNLTHSQSQTFPEFSTFFPTPTFCTSLSNPQLYQYLKQTHSTIPESHCEVECKLETSLEQVRTPSTSPSDSLTEEGEESSPTKTPEKVLEGCKEVTTWHCSYIPRMNNKTRMGITNKDVYKSTKDSKEDFSGRNKLKTSKSELKNRSKTGTNMVKSSFEAYEDKMLPALRSYHGNEVVRECQFAFDQQRKSTLNEREKKQAILPIAVFGIEMIEKFYSKSFNVKEEGLKQLQQELKRLVADGSGEKFSYNKIGRAAIFLLHRGLRDTVYSVYKLAAETVRVFFAEFVPQRLSQSEVARSVEKLLPELLTKSGDVTPRIHNLAAHTLLSMAECDEVRRLNLIPAHLSRPLTSSVHPRQALSRLEMVEQLILNHGISKEKKSGLTCRTLAEFGSSGLHHPAEPVRKVSERILIHVYKVNPRIVRKQLPPDDNVTRRNLLYRQLFQEFDFMDVQRKSNEQTMEDSLTFETIPTQAQNKNAEVRETEKKATKQPWPTNMSKPTHKRIVPESEPTFKGRQDEPKEAKTFTKCETSLKFPSLTDSIKTTKARMLTDQTKNSKTIRAGVPSLTDSLTRKETKRGSGIPVPTFGTGRKKLGKPSQNSGKPPDVLKKTIKIKMFDSPEAATGRVFEGNGTDKGENFKFSDSMLASIRENEFTTSNLFNGRDDTEEKFKMCIFCLSKKKWTNEDSLNKHYLKDCLMLTTCEYCMEVTEISGFTNHLLDDCKWKNLFQKCLNCQEATLCDLYDKHECTATGGKVLKTRCPFCHKTIGNEESSWRKHLTGGNTCPNHPRQK